jgi:alpha-methylacyl-CoA racemase
VLSIAEAHLHPHNQARASFAQVAGAWQPTPAPRFSRTASELPAGPRTTMADADEVLRQAGLAPADIQALRDSGVVQS